MTLREFIRTLDICLRSYGYKSHNCETVVLLVWRTPVARVPTQSVFPAGVVQTCSWHIREQFDCSKTNPTPVCIMLRTDGLIDFFHEIFHMLPPPPVPQPSLSHWREAQAISHHSSLDPAEIIVQAQPKYTHTPKTQTTALCSESGLQKLILHLQS